jgi:hypothetical protein
VICQMLRQTPEISGGSTGARSVLVLAEAWLNESTDHWNALQFVASRKDMARYDSVLDFVLCEVCVEERAACLRFYEGRGGNLASIRSERLIAYYDAKVLVFLEVCYAAHCERRRLSWSRAVQIVEEIEKAA